jgi:hypothetical protein
MIIRSLTALAFAMLAFAAGATELIPFDIKPFALDFDVSRNDKRLGEAKLSLERLSGETWLFRTHTVGTKGLASLAGVDIDERSEFHWVDGRPETLRYSFDQQMRFNSKQRSLSIMPNAERVSGHDDEGEFNLPYEAGLLDRNLVILALATDVAKEKQDAAYRIADKRKIDSNTYHIVGIEKVQTPRGPVDAVRVERIRSQPGRQTTTWIAPSLGFLPVRIRQVEPDGDTLDMTLR